MHLVPPAPPTPPPAPIDPRAHREARCWRGALIHHSATADTDHDDVAGIRRYHMARDNPNTSVLEGRGWQDIGYHGLIDRIDGAYRFVYGRPLTLIGSHCKGKNSTHLGLCLIGNFTNATPPIAQLDVAAEVLAEWCVSFGFGPEEIHGHRAFWPTDCPGGVDILGLRARVARILAHG